MLNKPYISNSISDQRRFFGRRKAKPLSEYQKNLYLQAQDKFFFELITDFNPSHIFLNPDAPLILEIGFGAGEHLLHQANLFPNTNFIGVDAYINGVSRVIRSIYEKNLINVRLNDSDALMILKALPESSLDGLYLLYPDPWPKQRHRNRRFIQLDTARLIQRALKPNGFFKFASDIPEYIEWVLAALYGATNMFADHNSHHTHPFENWTSTKYEKKAITEGRKSSYYCFRKPELIPTL